MLLLTISFFWIQTISLTFTASSDLFVRVHTQNPSNRLSSERCCGHSTLNQSQIRFHCEKRCVIRNLVQFGEWRVSSDSDQTVSIPIFDLYRSNRLRVVVVDAASSEEIVSYEKTLEEPVSIPTHWNSITVHGSNQLTLTLKYRRLCRPRFYGIGCEVYCEENERTKCDRNGSMICKRGWTGFECLQPVCSPRCLSNQGRCESTKIGNQCVCNAGYQGVSCEKCVKLPGCVSGTCRFPFECECDRGFYGVHCNSTNSAVEDRDYCRGVSCRNGGQCVSSESGFECLCRGNRFGLLCERTLAAGACGCMNGGKCRLRNRRVYCICDRRWTGRNCEKPIKLPPPPSTTELFNRITICVVVVVGVVLFVILSSLKRRGRPRKLLAIEQAI